MNDRIKHFLQKENIQELINNNDWSSFIFELANSKILDEYDFIHIVTLIESSLDIDLEPYRRESLLVEISNMILVLKDENTAPMTIDDFIDVYLGFNFGYTKNQISDILWKNAEKLNVYIYISKYTGKDSIRFFR